MGCDIHFVLEKNINNQWVGLLCSDNMHHHFAVRNYEFFTESAGVREDKDNISATKKQPTGFPEDASGLSLHHYDNGDWCHTPSCLSLKEFIECYCISNKDDFYLNYFKIGENENIFDFFLEKFLISSNLYEIKIEEYRIVFWFDD
jgi:hypothetical protein